MNFLGKSNLYDSIPLQDLYASELQKPGKPSSPLHHQIGHTSQYCKNVCRKFSNPSF